VHRNAASVFAMAKMIQEELKEYYDKSSFNQKESDRIEDRIKYIKGKAMKGEVSLSKED